MKKIIPFVILFLAWVWLSDCSNPVKTKGNHGKRADITQKDSLMVPDSMKEMKGWIDSLANCQIPEMKLPYYNDSTNSYFPYMYGSISAFDREDVINKTFFPPVPDLYYKSCLVYCQKDECRALRAVLAISSPNNKAILSWVSKKAQEFSNYILKNKANSINKLLKPSSSKHICDYYIGKIKKYFRQEVANCVHEKGVPNEQFVRMIAPVWNKGIFHTFIVYDWYDFMSCGNNTTVSYITINSRTGKELKLEKLIDKSDLRQLSNLLLIYLVNHRGKWIEETANITKDTGMELLSEIDGCALLGDGIVFYFHPYKIGCGADGQYNAIIPYEELNNEQIHLLLNI